MKKYDDDDDDGDHDDDEDDDDDDNDDPDDDDDNDYVNDDNDDDDGDDDIYIMMKCLSVTKNEHFPLLVIMVMVVMQRGQVLTISYVVHSFHLNRSLSLQLVV